MTPTCLRGKLENPFSLEPYGGWDFVSNILASSLTYLFFNLQMNRGKVSFKSSHVVHDYPSEETVTAVFDEYEKTNNTQLKTLQNYQPAGLVNMEKKLAHVGGHKQDSVTQPQPVSNGVKNAHDITASKSSHPEIKYADEGQAFTDSTDYASALLF